MYRRSRCELRSSVQFENESGVMSSAIDTKRLGFVVFCFRILNILTQIKIRFSSYPKV